MMRIMNCERCDAIKASKVGDGLRPRRMEGA